MKTMTKIKKTLGRAVSNLIWFAMAVTVCWLVFSVTVYRFQHPHLTETEIFLAIPKAVMLR
jgi:hypothetical protein